jgi:hypothetical protein
MLGAAATQMRPRCHSSRRRGTPSDRMQAAARLRRPIAHSARTGPRRAQCPAPAHRRSRREAPLRRGSRDKWTSSYSTSRQRAVVVRSPSSPDRSGATHARTECGGWVFGLRCCSSARELASAPAPADARKGRFGGGRAAGPIMPASSKQLQQPRAVPARRAPLVLTERLPGPLGTPAIGGTASAESRISPNPPREHCQAGI